MNQTVDWFAAARMYFARAHVFFQFLAVALLLCGLAQPASAQPVFEDNTPFIVTQGGAGTINSNNLWAVDQQVGPSGIIFIITAGGPSDGPPREGILTKNGVPLGVGSTFTADDINNKRVSYQQTVPGCATYDDFQCSLTNSLGKAWADTNGRTTFLFQIQIVLVDQRPITSNSAVTIPLGTTYQGTCVATNPDCLNQPLRYFVTSPIKGTLTAFDSNTGAFTYVAAIGQSGQDAFAFQVFDGVRFAAQAGTVSVNLQVPPPAASASAFEVDAGLPFGGMLAGMDFDLPPLPLTYTIVTPPILGTVTITNASSGGFRYISTPGRFGPDSFSFKVNNGFYDSPPATVSVTIQPRGLAPGNILITDYMRQELAVLNPVNADFAVLSQGNLLALPTGVEYEPTGTVLVTDLTNGLIRVKPSTGEQTLLVGHETLPYPVDVAKEPGGTILVADPIAGVMRFSNSGVLITNLPRGSLVAPVGVAMGTNGQIFVADIAVFFGGPPESNKIVQIDPVTLAQTIISSGGLLTTPVSIIVEPDGNILTCQFAANTVVRVSYPGGSQSVVGGGGSLDGAFGVTVDDTTGNVFVASLLGGPVVDMHHITGAQTTVHPRSFDSQGIGVVGPSIPSLAQIQPIAPGQFLLQFHSAIGSANTVLATTNPTLPLAQWTVLGQANEIADGEFQFVDAAATNVPVRFYQVRSP